MRRAGPRFTDLEVSEAQQGLEYDADEIEDIDAVCQLLCKLARCKALISSVESWVRVLRCWRRPTRCDLSS